MRCAASIFMSASLNEARAAKSSKEELAQMGVIASLVVASGQEWTLLDVVLDKVRFEPRAVIRAIA